jgi:hypothetical protein
MDSSINLSQNSQQIHIEAHTTVSVVLGPILQQFHFLMKMLLYAPLVNSMKLELFLHLDWVDLVQEQ